MKKIIFSLILISIWFNGANAQNAYLTNALTAKIAQLKSDETQFIRVDIILKQQLDCYTLGQDFDNKQTPSQERAKIVISKLMSISSASQKDVLNFLNQNNQESQNIEKFWIVNMIVADVSPKLIQQLIKLNAIDYIDLDESHIVQPIKPVQTYIENNKSIGGIEPGLLAINAPAMWAIGYTGSGRISFTLDTGIWPNHPTFRNRFLGNHFPLKQSWLGFDSPTPKDKGNSHGTHVTGTTLGLDNLTNDTIGVAYNAYFIVSDPVATSLATVKPITAFVTAFQWALNPDGDTNTTSDIPDVINNSWGYSVPTDTLLCNSFISVAFEVIQTAGIACIFSAGNDGPGDSTISSPHHISTGLVNTFTVGSVSPHDTTFPISSFSSRGPTICPVSGALAIKPEIVAPGQQIRSSVDQSNYAVYDGTSMASPHVTGAVLLLKEAFPNVTGEEILLAIYYSAKDLGVVGEDNTYGRGMIDVYAAYLYLAQTNTPVAPRSKSYDIAIDSISNFNSSFICDTIISPQIELANHGDSSLTGITILYKINNGTENSYSWNGTLLANQHQSITLPSINVGGFGDKELFVRAELAANVIENDDINNRFVVRFNVRGEATLPFFEDFETTNLTDRNWFAENPDQFIGWKTASTGGLFGTQSAQVECFDYTPRNSQKDDLLSPIFEAPANGLFTLIFARAYMFKHALLADTLKVYVTHGCDLNQRTLVFAKGGLNLSTFDSASAYFTPTSPDQWTNDTIDLSTFAGQGKLMIDFQTTNRFGNNIYIDNVRLFEGTNPPVGFPEDVSKNVSIYPNPANTWVKIKYNETSTMPVLITLTDAYGRQLLSQTCDGMQNGEVELSLEKYSSGLYFIFYQSQNTNRSFKLIKK